MTGKLNTNLFLEKLEKIKKNILLDLDEYYSDWSVWKGEYEGGLETASLYKQAAGSCLEANLLYERPYVPFAQKFLIPDRSLFWKDNHDYTQTHLQFLVAYFIECACVQFVLENECDAIELLKQSTLYHKGYMQSFGYEREADAVVELKLETALDMFVPQLIVNTCLENDYSHVITQVGIQPNVKHNLWYATIEFINLLPTKETKNLEDSFVQVLNEWRVLFSFTGLSLFRMCHLVLMYRLYCQAVGCDFSLKSLSAQLLDI